MQCVYAYSPYGEATALGPDGGNALQYTGRENDGTGLYDYRFRQYDPILKRFISEDPIGINGSLNLQTYVDGNPASYNDPLGLMGFGSGGSAGTNKSNGSVSRGKIPRPCDEECRECKQKWLTNTYGDFFGRAADSSSLFGYVSPTRAVDQAITTLKVGGEKAFAGAVVEFFIGRELLYLSAGATVALFRNVTLVAGAGFVGFGTAADILASSHCGCDVLQ